MTGDTLSERLSQLLADWRDTRRPSTSEYLRIGRSLLDWKTGAGIAGLWQRPPRMVTATLDDGLGNGLQPIHLFAELAGLEVLPLGMMVTAADIAAACNRHLPELLGLTILQLDTLEELQGLLPSLPQCTRVVVGGPAVRGVVNGGWNDRGYYAARDVSAFLEFLLREVPNRSQHS